MNTYQCLQCGWESTTPDRVRVVFHPCYPDRVRRRLTLEEVLPYPETNDETNADWFEANYPTPEGKR